MKRKSLIFVSLLILCATLLALPVSAKEDRAKAIFDRADFLDDSAEKELQALAEEMSERTGCSFYVATHEMKTSYDEYWGEDFLQDQGLSQGSNIILLVVTLDRGTYYYDLYTYGNAYRRISDLDEDTILDSPDVYTGIKNGRLKEGASAFLRVSAEVYEKAVKRFTILLFVVSLGIAVAIGIGSCASIYRSYTAKTRSVDYPLEQFAKMELTHKEDVFVGSFVTTRVIRTNNGSSGGGFSGSGHGGGGGHRGGR